MIGIITLLSAGAGVAIAQLFSGVLGVFAGLSSPI